MSTTAIMSFEVRRYAFLFLAVLCGLLAASYLFLLNQTIRDVVAVEDAKHALVMLNSEVSDLESKYLVARASVNLETALALGFHDASSVSFLARSSEHTRLTLVTRGTSE